MELEKLHSQISERLAELDFERLWPGFKPLKFALFNDEKCFFDGRFVEKTDAFCANTSIVYEGEQIATWMVSGETELTVLVSKLVHEMFHGYQAINGWNCGINELEALFRYEYSAENLAIKLRENELLSALIDRRDDAALNELLALRRLRSERFPYEFSYELQTEKIEGSANYVEWQALKQLDASRADALMERLRQTLTEPENLFPIRISCYGSGALMINALVGAGRYCFDAAERPALLNLIGDIAPSDGCFPRRDGLLASAESATAAYNETTDAIIKSALEKNEIVLEGPHELGFVNFYDARFRGGYLTSTYFLAYRKGDEYAMLSGGDFVIKMRDEKTIETVYKWK